MTKKASVQEAEFEQAVVAVEGSVTEAVVAPKKVYHRCTFAIGDSRIRVEAETEDDFNYVAALVAELPDSHIATRAKAPKPDELAMALSEVKGSSYEVAKEYIDRKEVEHRGFKRRLRGEHAIKAVLLRYEQEALGESNNGEDLLGDF
jgi:hypothetical protein